MVMSESEVGAFPTSLQGQTGAPLRILLADDHPHMLEVLRQILTGWGEVVGAVTDGHALVETAQQLRPDVILLDISMPLLNGLDAARQLISLVPESKLIFVTVHAQPTYVSLAFEAGAAGYILKRSIEEELPQALALVLKGHTYLSESLRT